MIYRYAISIILIILSIIILTQKPENKKENIIPYFSVSDIKEEYINPEIKSEEINEILSKLKAEKGVIIEKIKIDSNYNFDSNTYYSIYIKRNIPTNTKIIKNYELKKYKIFDFLKIDLEKLWQNASDAPSPEFFQFSGVITKENQKKAYIYFNGVLKEINENMQLGNYSVLKIFNNGVLLFDRNKKQFEVLR
ncbi:hypothetical protein X275_00540 [Marinitoga sp. 1197]|uniref:hypothetical protein n=1 Tax=Marinitoga sp. 1197 TaxID=1428449 RepID=UPI0006410CDA|nr:hypothetical protein [Marinitoga sp. 1197]KLO24318.1 hypothetical protein X275_00540 [Marinitoga sp. 1197]